jgi:hypothetical protein
MISIVYNSTKIEGCSLDENDSRLLIENNITAKGNPLTDHLMVKDHFLSSPDYSSFKFFIKIYLK